jgi:hypothetical protein
LSSFPYLDLANKNALAVAGNSYQNAYRSFFGRVMYNYGCHCRSEGLTEPEAIVPAWGESYSR